MSGVIVAGLSGGCASSPQVADREPIEEAPVSPSEYPEYEFTQSTYPVSVGVLGANNQPRKPLLQPLKPIELTEREKEALAELEKEQSYDALALYPGAQAANITPELAGPNVGIYGETNRSTGLLWGQPLPIANVYDPGSGNEIVGITHATGVAASLPNNKEGIAGLAPPSEVDVGYLPSQPTASYDPHIERD